jgi:hypothetical protein
MSASPPPPPAGSLGGLPRPRFSPLPLPRAPLGGILAAPAAGGPGINGIAAASKSLPGSVAGWSAGLVSSPKRRVFMSGSSLVCGPRGSGRTRAGLRHEAAPRWASGARCQWAWSGARTPIYLRKGINADGNRSSLIRCRCFRGRVGACAFQTWKRRAVGIAGARPAKT